MTGLAAQVASGADKACGPGRTRATELHGTSSTLTSPATYRRVKNTCAGNLGPT